MKFEPLEIKDSFIIQPNVFEDDRGCLVKTFEVQEYLAHALDLNFEEEYFSSSKKKVLRGVHVQVAPYAMSKLIYCLSGEILDVAVDLRQDSPTYLREQVVSLGGKSRSIIYIPPHVGHAFYTLSDHATIVCKATRSYAPAYEKVICWSSLKMNWPDRAPLLSQKDRAGERLLDFVNQYSLTG